MNSLLIVMVLTTGSCGFGSAGVPAGFVKDVKTIRLGATTACHKAEDAEASLEASRALKRFEVVFATFSRAADTAHEETLAVVKSRNRTVVVTLQSTVHAANSTIVQPHIRLIAAARPLLVQFMRSILVQTSATSGVLWDDPKLLDEVSRIA